MTFCKAEKIVNALKTWTNKKIYIVGPMQFIGR